MKPRISKLLHPFVPLALLVHGQQALSQQDIFEGLDADRSQIHDAVERHSLRIEKSAGSAEIPSSVSYRIFVRELLDDPNRAFEIPREDLAILEELADASTQELAGIHHGALTELCMRVADSEGSPEEILELATLFEESRTQSEHELDIRFAEALNRLSPKTAAEVETRWEDFSARRMVVYTAFDMPGFAREMPEAGHRMLQAGCTRFHDMTGNR